ncbi:MAG: IS5/IS1182 family transposase, partial [Thermoguttaceae bacterium]|nr:IS5/IS1182 family transposase [Thermoguttaceae bacterium]
MAIEAKTQQIVAAEMTSNSRDDASVVPDLLTHIDGNVVSLRGDGAYDKRSV